MAHDETARPKMAQNLQVASNQDTVHIDHEGRVRSPLRYKAILITFYGLLGVLGIAEVALVYDLYRSNGALGAAMGALVALAFSWAGWAVSRQFALRRAFHALAADRIDEAEDIYAGVLRGRLLPPKYRTLARQGLAACLALRGQHAEALAELRSVLEHYGRSPRVHARVARYAEVGLLVNVGELDEARTKLDALGPVPAGEYFQIRHWTAELYLAFAEGTHTIDDDELHRRAHAALAITSAGPLLGLLAWAFRARNDEEMAELLLREARDRDPGVKLSGPMPFLRAWMEAEPPTARVEDELDAHEEEVEVGARRGARTRAAE